MVKMVPQIGCVQLVGFFDDVLLDLLCSQIVIEELDVEGSLVLGKLGFRVLDTKLGTYVKQRYADSIPLQSTIDENHFFEEGVLINECPSPGPASDVLVLMSHFEIEPISHV